MAAYITVGAKTDHGGTVITGSAHTLVNGIPVARKGDKVQCKKCKKVVTIVTGDPAFVIDGAPVARAGDITSCGSKLIAVQQAFAESDFDVMGVERPEQYMATYGDVNQGSDSGSYFSIEDVYLNNNLFSPYGIKTRNHVGHHGQSSRNAAPDKYDKIYIKVKVQSGSFKNFKLDVSGTPTPLSSKSGTFNKGDIITLEWDGFIGDIYASKALLAGVDLKVSATDLSSNTIASDIEKVVFKFKKQDWIDISIDRQAKRIVANLRVSISELKWDIVPDRVVSNQTQNQLNRPIIFRDKMSDYLTNSEVESLVKQGVSRYWSRQHNTIKSKRLDIDVHGEKFQVSTKCEITDRNSMPKMNIIFNTNSVPGRSRYWEASRMTYYNIGYLLLTDSHGKQVWRFRQKSSADKIFKRVFAHEIGHEILLANGGQHYSKTHKGSSTILQAVNGTYTATGSEYDLMKYAEQNPQDYDDKVVASEEDVLGLLAISQLTL
ncbi:MULTISPECIES: PAAR domain-containing protein [unclassified Psychrobacter]|uniref:PAAR domain-containing protein n=1 Tax=unclassified Psychrobacter TaxID=196806 RepID=UPI0018F45281|nr:MULTISPECIES: PAAR domain-containing protein [unclassified Psychrobacter]